MAPGAGRDLLLELISYNKHEEEVAKVSGENWRMSDFKARQSYIGGEICELYAKLDRLIVKASCRPRSKGARKAKREAKRIRREIGRLQNDLLIKYTDYRPEQPTYYKAPPSIDPPSLSKPLTKNRRPEKMLPLKRCPHCGGRAQMEVHYIKSRDQYYVYVKCEVCGAQGTLCKTVIDPLNDEGGCFNFAAAAWNMRTNEEEGS